MQSPKLVFLLALIATVSVTFSASASTQDRQAQQTLEKALQALGGIERLRNLNSLFFKGKGSEFRSVDLQGPDPSTPTKTFHEETTAAFPSWLMNSSCMSMTVRSSPAYIQRRQRKLPPHLLLLEIRCS